MIGAVERKRLVRWWGIGLALVVLIAAGAAAALFIPQERALKRARANAHEVEEQLQSLGLTSFKKAYGDLEEKVRATQARLDGLELFPDRPGQDVVLDALNLALSGGEVALAELAPLEDKTKERAKSATTRRAAPQRAGGAGPSAATPTAATPTGQGWRLKCAGSFAGLVALLHRIESRGVLFDVGEFELTVSEEDRRLELSTVLRVYPPEALPPSRRTAKGAPEAASDGPAKPKRSAP